jgi:hypothetical protein
LAWGSADVLLDALLAAEPLLSSTTPALIMPEGVRR